MYQEIYHVTYYKSIQFNTTQVHSVQRKNSIQNQCSSLLIVAYRCLSLLIVAYLCLPLLIVAYRCLSLLIVAYITSPDGPRHFKTPAISAPKLSQAFQHELQSGLKTKQNQFMNAPLFLHWFGMRFGMKLE